MAGFGAGGGFGGLVTRPSDAAPRLTRRPDGAVQVDVPAGGALPYSVIIGEGEEQIDTHDFSAPLTIDAQGQAVRFALRVVSEIPALPPATSDATVPATMTGAMWHGVSLESPGGDRAGVDILELPDDGGASITTLQASIDGAAWFDLADGASLGLRTFTVLADATVSLRVRAVNSEGPGAAEGSATVTALRPMELVDTGTHGRIARHLDTVPTAYDYSENQTITMTAAQMVAAQSAPVFAAAPKLTWAAGDGATPDSRLRIDKGFVVAHGEEHTIDWTLTDSAGAVLAEGAGFAPLTHKLAVVRPGDRYTLHQTVADAAGVTTEATTNLDAADTPPHLVTRAAFDNTAFYERAANDWSNGDAIRDQLLVVQSARTNPDVFQVLFAMGGKSSPLGIRYQYRRYQLSLLGVDGSQNYVDLLAGMTTADPTTALVRITAAGNGSTAVSWAVHDGSAWSTGADDVPVAVDFGETAAWAIGRNPTDTVDTFAGDVLRAAMWVAPVAGELPSPATSAVQDLFVDASGAVVADASRAQSGLSLYDRPFDKYGDWATGSNDGTAGPFTTINAAEVV